MAQREFTTNPKLPMFYNVDQAVGPGRTNRRDDVMLVQYLLKGIYSRPGNFQPPMIRPSGKDMVIDGLFGPQTKKWIAHFQIEGRNRGNNIATDGVVDRATQGTASSTISDTFYTIVFMNFAFKKAKPEVSDITLDPECPAELRAAIGVNPVGNVA